MKNLRDYFPEFVMNFLAIFLGVLATLYLTGKITENDERKNLRLQLDALKIELNENIKSIDEVLTYLEREDSVRKYIMSVKSRKQIDVDSLKKYNDIMQVMQIFTYKKDAYEMLKFTGSMRLINDKQKLLDIMTCYNALEEIKNGFDLISNYKLSLLNQVLNIDFDFFDLRKPAFTGLYHYFNGYTGIKHGFEMSKKQIEKTLEKL